MDPHPLFYSILIEHPLLGKRIIRVGLGVVVLLGVIVCLICLPVGETLIGGGRGGGGRGRRGGRGGGGGGGGDLMGQ